MLKHFESLVSRNRNRQTFNMTSFIAKSKIYVILIDYTISQIKVSAVNSLFSYSSFHLDSIASYLLLYRVNLLVRNKIFLKCKRQHILVQKPG